MSGVSRQHTVRRRIAIRPAAETSRLITDAYDVTDGELFEIEPSAHAPTTEQLWPTPRLPMTYTGNGQNVPVFSWVRRSSRNPRTPR